MFGWLRPAPRCPVELTDKVWIEQRFAWLIQKLGTDSWQKLRVVLPTEEFFPDRFDGSEDDAQQLFCRVAAYMGVRPDRIELGFADTEDDPDWAQQAGIYVGGPPERIVLRRSGLSDPQALVAVIAHELAHAILLGDQWLTQDAGDHEFVTDLTTVFRGLGIFSANSAIRERFWSDLNSTYSHYSRLGYLSERAFGYAFALFCWLRNEGNPDWLGHLRPNVRTGVRQGLQFLMKTGDSLVTPDHLARPFPNQSELTIAKVQQELSSDSPSRRLAMVWELRRRLDLAQEVLPPLEKLLNDADPQLAAETMDLLCRIGVAARTMVPTALDCSADALPLLSSSAFRLVAATEDSSLSTAYELVLRLKSSLIRPQTSSLIPPTIPTVGYAGVQRPAVEMLHAAKNFCLGLSDEVTQRKLLQLLKQAASGPVEIAEPAVQSLRAFGPRAIDLLDDLLFLVEHSERNLTPSLYETLLAVAPDDPRVLEVLRLGLDEEDPQVVVAAVETLAKMGKSAQPAIGDLARHRTSDDLALRFATADAVAKICGEIGEALEIYQRALPYPFADFSSDKIGGIVEIQRVIKSLQTFGNDATSALLRIGDTTSQPERCFAVWGLGVTGTNVEPVREWLRDCVHSENPIEQFLAAASLVRCGGEPSEVAPSFLRLASSPIRNSPETNGRIDPLIHWASTRFLGLIGRPSATCALEQLANPSIEPEPIQSVLGELLVSIPNTHELEQQARLQPEPMRSRFQQSVMHAERWKQKFQDQLERSRSIPPMPEIEAFVLPNAWTHEDIMSSFLWEAARVASQSKGSVAGE